MADGKLRFHGVNMSNSSGLQDALRRLSGGHGGCDGFLAASAEELSEQALPSSG